MNRMEAAKIMAACRLSNRKAATIRNDQLAVASGLCTKDEAIDFCHSLGLYAWGKKGHTSLQLMTEHLKRTGLICI